MARQINKYIIPDLGAIENRIQAEDALMKIYQANQREIIKSVRQFAADTGGELPDDLYDVFAESVLNNLSVKYGGYDPRTKIKRKGKIIDNDVKFEEALERTLRGHIFTPYEDVAKRNFLTAIKNNYSNYWNFLRNNMRRANAGYFYEDLYLEDVWYDESAGYYLVRLANGRLIRFVHEPGPNGSPQWVAYDDATGEQLQI